MARDDNVNKLGAAIDSPEHLPDSRQVEGASRGAHYELPEKLLKWRSRQRAGRERLMNGSIGSAYFRIVARDPVAASLGPGIDDFDLPPFSQQVGLGRVHKLFGAELPMVIEELSRELVE